MKHLVGHEIGSAVFDPSNRTVTFVGVTLSQEQILTIVNTSKQTMIYCFAVPTLGGSLSGQTLTVDYDTTAMSANDALQVYVDVPQSRPLAFGLDSTTVSGDHPLPVLDESVSLLKRIVSILKPLSVIAGGGSSKLLVDVGTAAAVTTVSTVSNVTTVATVTNLNNIAGITAFEMLRSMSRSAYNSGPRSKVS